MQPGHFVAIVLHPEKDWLLIFSLSNKKKGMSGKKQNIKTAIGKESLFLAWEVRENFNRKAEQKMLSFILLSFQYVK